MSNPPPIVVIFILGTLGAVAPEIVRLYGLRRSWKKESFSLGYWFISAAYAALGGVLAVILPAVNLYAAFYAGVTMPFTISAMARNRHKGLIALVNCKEEVVTATNERPSEVEAQPPKRSIIEIFRSHADGLFDD